MAFKLMAEHLVIFYLLSWVLIHRFHLWKFSKLCQYVHFSVRTLYFNNKFKTRRKYRWLRHNTKSTIHERINIIWTSLKLKMVSMSLAIINEIEPKLRSLHCKSWHISIFGGYLIQVKARSCVFNIHIEQGFQETGTKENRTWRTCLQKNWKSEYV